MKEAQNRSRRCLRSESDKGVVIANFVEREGMTTFVISGGSVDSGSGG